MNAEFELSFREGVARLVADDPDPEPMTQPAARTEGELQ